MISGFPPLKFLLVLLTLSSNGKTEITNRSLPQLSAPFLSWMFPSCCTVQLLQDGQPRLLPHSHLDTFAASEPAPSVHHFLLQLGSLNQCQLSQYVGTTVVEQLLDKQQ